MKTRLLRYQRGSSLSPAVCAGILSILSFSWVGAESIRVAPDGPSKADRYRASLRAEANAAGMSRSEAARVNAVMTARRERQRDEQARERWLQVQRSLGRAKADADLPRSRRSGNLIEASRLEPLSRLRESEGPSVRRNVLVSDVPPSDDARILAEAGVPFGVPVPGRPGFITAPSSEFHGYIDVRRFSPGSVIVDPFTGERLRVP